MNTKNSFLLIAVAISAIFAATPRASAVPVTFSGGSVTPLSFSLAAPVSYTITGAPSGNAPFFVFQNTGNLAFGSSIISTITFSVNSGPAQALSIADSGTTGGVITANDLFFNGALPMLNIGDVVTLTAGSWTTISPVVPAAPANGSYTTFITDGFGNVISTNGVSGFSTPESLSTLWLALPLVGMFAVRRRFTVNR